MEVILLKDTSKLKGIYKVPKKPGRPKDLKTIPKIKAKSISPLKKQKRKQMETKTYKKSILRITNRRRNKIVIKSSSDEDKESIIIKSSDDEVKAEDKAEDETEDEAEDKTEDKTEDETENEAEDKTEDKAKDETEDEAEDEAEKHEMRISASRRPQRNIQLPVRYRG